MALKFNKIKSLTTTPIPEHVKLKIIQNLQGKQQATTAAQQTLTEVQNQAAQALAMALAATNNASQALAKSVENSEGIKTINATSVDALRISAENSENIKAVNSTSVDAIKAAELALKDVKNLESTVNGSFDEISDILSNHETRLEITEVNVNTLTNSLAQTETPICSNQEQANDMTIECDEISANEINGTCELSNTVYALNSAGDIVCFYS
jgi:hypothetical protein